MPGSQGSGPGKKKQFGDDMVILSFSRNVSIFRIASRSQFLRSNSISMAVLLLSLSALILGVTPQAKAQTHVGRPIPKSQAISPKTLSQLFPYKDDVVKGTEDYRTPVILIHGIGAETDRNYFNWARFLEFTDAKPEFQKHYKVYLYRYDTTKSVPNLSKGLQEDLREFISNLHGRKMRILAYSEGGLLTRNVMQDPVINAHTERVITIATPFHGSPLANPGWVKEQLKEESSFSAVKMTNGLSYWIAKKKYPTFEADFQWDNFDKALSHQPYEHAKNPSDYVTAYSNKLITYGSYFGGSEIDPNGELPKALGLEKPLPKEKVRLRMPWSRHLMFTLIRKNISRLPLAYLPFYKKNSPQEVVHKETVQTRQVIQNAEELVIQGDQITKLPKEMEQEVLALTATTVDTPDTAAVAKALDQAAEALLPLMLYNDGISPISSSLWLGRFTAGQQQNLNPTGQMWQALKGLQAKNCARLLPGLDHRDWMDGTTRYNTNTLPDLLHPSEPPRSTFDWLLLDLTAKPGVAPMVADTSATQKLSRAR
jgi:hypothetical protein